MKKSIYYIAHKDGLRLVEGKSVELFSWIPTFVHKNEDSGYWVISEVSTGCLIAVGKTLKTVTDNAVYVLNYYGEEAVKALISVRPKVPAPIEGE
jgi:hypothetical protein